MFVDTRALDIDVIVHRMGKSWSQIHSEPSLTCGPVDDLDFKDTVYVNGAGRDTSKCCLPGTRESILSEIKDWINRTGDAQGIFWLSGTAGKGKSSIGHTTRNLAYHDPIMRWALASAVHDDELRHTRDIARQWKNFILGPAGAASQAVDTPVLVVISAVAFFGEMDGLDRADVIIIIVTRI